METSADKSPQERAQTWLRRHVVALSVVAGLIALYALAGFLLVPRIARSQALGYVQHQLHRQLAIGELKFNPFTFAVEVHQLALSEADGEPIARFSMLRVKFSAIASLLHRAWTLSELRLQQPFIHVLVNHDGSLNLAKLSPPSKSPPPPPSNSLPQIRIGAFSLSQGRVHFEDRSRDEAPFSTNLTPIEFDLTDFRTQPNFENKYQFSAATAAGEKFDWSGQFDVQPLSSNGEFSVTGLKAATIAAYLEDALPFAMNSGTMDLNGKYQVAMPQGSGGPTLSLALPYLKVHSLAIAPRDAQAGAAPWVQLPEFDVLNTAVALTERTVSVGEVSLQQPVIVVWREKGGALNLQQLTGAPKKDASVPAAPATPAATASPPWKLTLAKLAIDAADVSVEDRSLTPVMKLHVAPLTVSVQNASSEGTQPLSFDVNAGLNDDGQLHSAGTVTLTPLLAQLGVELKDFDLTALQPYVNQQADMSITRGRAASDLKLAYADKPAKGKPQLQVTGSAQVSELATRDNVTNADFVTWDLLQISGLRYQMQPDALSIDRVYANGLYSRVIVSPNGTINIRDVMRPAGSPLPVATPDAASTDAGNKTAAARNSPPAAKASATGSTAPSMPMRIKRIDIEKTTANFSDHSIEPNFSAGIFNLHGSITGLSSAPSARAQITLDGNVDEFSPVQIRGEINPLAAVGYTDVTMSFHNMELTTFNPYSGRYAGYSIAQGKLSTDLHYHIDNRKLDATHHIVIDQLEFGAATESKQAVPLPIKLAAAILKDRNGVITLDLPEIKGTIDDPTFKIGPLIWTFVVDLMKKIVSAPFAAIGALFGGGHELSYVDFQPGSTTLTDTEAPKLAKLADALVEKPQLKLDVPLHTISEADEAALAKAALDQAVTAAGATGSSKRARKSTAAGEDDSSGRLMSLLILYRQKFNAEPEYPGEAGGKAQSSSDPNSTAAAHVAWLEQQLLPQFTASTDQKDGLGRARAQAVQSALLTNKELNAERVFLTERASSGVESGQTRMELKLE